MNLKCCVYVAVLRVFNSTNTLNDILQYCEGQTLIVQDHREVSLFLDRSGTLTLNLNLNFLYY